VPVAAETRAHTVPKFYLNGFVAVESQAGSDPHTWIGSLENGEIVRRSPKNISIARGAYDGPGGFHDPEASIEAHLAKIESAAATAIRKFAAVPIGANPSIPPEIARFISWQACRTPGWREAEQQWINDLPVDDKQEPIEPPPPGIENIGDRARPLLLEDPESGTRREVVGRAEVEAHRRQGWKIVLRRDDHLELMHLQAWYFQVRHFPRLDWVRLQPPDGEFFITSDRGVAWLIDGYHGETPPAALRDPLAMVFAPLTSRLTLIGRHGEDPINATPREINCRIALAASAWVAGPTREAVRQALIDRASFKGH
jgi:hypothetical protein